MAGVEAIADMVARRLVARNENYRRFFDREASRLSNACREMAGRFERGGRLLAFGRGPYATDAQHVSVEFIHPVIVGKRALPALDLSAMLDAPLETLIGPADIVMGFGPPEGDPRVACALSAARRIGAMTFALPGEEGDYWVQDIAPDAFQHQETIEVLYHTLWETVHVFLEHKEVVSDAGQAGFLYPFLSSGIPAQTGGTAPLCAEVAESIRMKAADDARLREGIAAAHADRIAECCAAMAERLRGGGKLLIFGNGGSATDANDWALDCVLPPAGMAPIPAVSFSTEPAVLTAIANDVGIEAVFLRQLIAHARPQDVAIGISTSGGSRNLLACFEEARRRNLLTVALLGYDGGEVVRRQLTDFPLVIPCDYIPRIQEVQASMYHVMREALDCALRG